MVQAINNSVDKRNKAFKSCCESGTIILELYEFMNLIYELGTVNAYTTLIGNDIKTIKKVEEAINILKAYGIKIVAVEPFKKYSYGQCGGWGQRFNGRNLSIIHELI